MANKKLYPFRLVPQVFVKAWGEESWLLANMGSVETMIENGYLKGNTIADLMETYMEQIVGEKTFRNFGTQFPILLKYLRIQGSLSFQVHPDDAVALERYDSLGKSEMWYVLDASEDATVYLGFNKDTNATELWNKCHDGSILEIVGKIHPHKGDVIKIPPGTVHAASGNIVVAEVQESSDLTFRLYDWGRENNPLTARAMHLEEAIDIVDYKKFNIEENYIKASAFAPSADGYTPLAQTGQYKVSKLVLSEPKQINTSSLDTFLTYTCLDGSVALYAGDTLQTEDKENTYVLEKGETMLIPADVDNFYLIPLSGEATLLEAYTPGFDEVDSYTGEEETESVEDYLDDYGLEDDCDCDDDDCDCDHEHYHHHHHHDCDCGHHHN